MPHSITVLVVEDEFLVRMNIVDQLVDLGFDVFEASNADDAIGVLADNEAVQVMFTDVDMPGSMDGLRLAAAVRDRWPPIKIIVTSGHRSVAKSKLPESSRFFEKPYDCVAVAKAMREMMA